MLLFLQLGNDPQLRDALMQIAKLYSSYQSQSGHETRKRLPESFYAPFINESGTTFQSDSTNSTLSLSPNAQFPPPLLSGSSSSPAPQRPNKSKGFSMEDLLHPREEATSSSIPPAEPVTPMQRVRAYNDDDDNTQKLFRPFEDHI